MAAMIRRKNNPATSAEEIYRDKRKKTQARCRSGDKYRRQLGPFTPL